MNNQFSIQFFSDCTPACDVTWRRRNDSAIISKNQTLLLAHSHSYPAGKKWEVKIKILRYKGKQIDNSRLPCTHRTSLGSENRELQHVLQCRATENPGPSPF